MMNLFVASAKEQYADTTGHNDARGQEEGEMVTKCAAMSGASRKPDGPMRVELGMLFQLQWHQTLTSARLR
jgi:hypothetical protein